MRNVWSAVCSHAALTWMQVRQKETVRNGKMERAVRGFKNSPVVDSLASHALGDAPFRCVTEPTRGPELRQRPVPFAALSYAGPAREQCISSRGCAGKRTGQELSRLLSTTVPEFI